MIILPPESLRVKQAIEEFAAMRYSLQLDQSTVRNIPLLSLDLSVFNHRRIISSKCGLGQAYLIYQHPGCQVMNI